MQIAIIGAGAAGCFTAIHLKQRIPTADITVYEGQQRALAKVAITGGGRCNLTNSFAQVKSLESIYPRGTRLMKRLLQEFSHRNTFVWFEKQGVKLVTQSDECVFPASQNALQIVNTLLGLMQNLGVKLCTRHRLAQIEAVGSTELDAKNNQYQLTFTDPQLPSRRCDTVVVTTGGSPRLSGLDFLLPLQLEIETPVPSLFSFCLEGNSITELTGTVVENVTTTWAGTRLKGYGPLLITHWGLSGPAILKLSSQAARLLADINYQGTVVINWFGEEKETEVLEQLAIMAQQHPQKQLQSIYPTRFNNRLWCYLLAQAGIDPTQRWAGINRKSLNRLASTLTNHSFKVTGKNRFKDEFVTCGGVSLSNVNPSTLECRKHPNLYFAGEVLDVDAVTGGFNLQAAWTMGYVVAQSIAKKFSNCQEQTL